MRGYISDWIVDAFVIFFEVRIFSALFDDFSTLEG